MVGFTTSVLATLLAAQAVVASPLHVRTPYALKESHFVPRAWKKVERAPADHVIDLKIGVKQGNFAALEKHLYEVSNPRHHRYGQHLSADEVKELVKPSDESLKLVHEWLDAHGVAPSQYSSAKDWVTVTLPVEAAEQLLDTKYHTYRHTDGSIVVRTPEWSLPEHLHAHIDTVQPTNSFFRARAHKATYDDAPFYASLTTQQQQATLSNSTIGQLCNTSSVTPECFEVLYQTKGYTPQSTDKNTIGFANYLGEHPIRSDLKQFLTKYRPEGVAQADAFKQLVIQDGPGDYALTPEEATAGTSKEANLDVQAITGINWETPVISYSTGGSPPWIPSPNSDSNTNEPYLDWVNYLLDQPSIPAVVSTSYGDEEQTVPESYAKRVCAQFAQVGVRGTSLLFSSGDNGVGPDGGACLTNDGKNTTTFLPEFPGTCPYITSVGATMNFEPEEVAYRPGFTGPDGRVHSAYTSGGGFSRYFDTPLYQLANVRSYVRDLKGQFDGLYAKTGRAYPDIAAQGLYFAYFWNGTEGVISGTSASTPLTSGIFSLVNDARIAAGKPTLGFLNPWLYLEGHKGLTDVVSGSAHGCDTDGFPATKGWDPVTGLGTPIFPELVKLSGGKLH